MEPLFFSDRVSGRSFSVNRAISSSLNRGSSSCQLAICPLSSSRRAFHSDAELQIVPRASNIKKFIAIRVRGRVEEGLGNNEATRILKSLNLPGQNFERNHSCLIIEGVWREMF